MRYALLVLVLSILACRVEGVDYDADLWTDGDVEVEADARRPGPVRQRLR